MATSCLWGIFLFATSFTSLFSAIDCFVLDDSPSDAQYSIETRVFVDKHAFDRWDDYVHNILTDKDRGNQPRKMIQEYVTSAFVGVNNIYKNMADSGARIDVRIVSIEYITDETIAVETSPGAGFVDLDNLLDQFYLWLQTKHYPRTDHSMLITGLNITNTTDPDNDPLGVAKMGKMCSDKSISAVESIPNGKVSSVMAHEIAHSLNASHDGDGNSCSNETKNLMDPKVERNTTHVYQFSPCSVDYITNMLAALDRDPAGNCLTTTHAHPVSSVPLGKLFTADQICQLTVGNHSYVCRNLYGYNTQPSYSSVCGAVWCMQEPGRCQNIFGTDGMTCGTNKECYQGECVPSSTAPDVSDTCPFGDSPWYSDMHTFSDNNETCAELIRPGARAYCYKDNVRRICCGQCEAGVTNNPNCMYGDKSLDCASLAYPYTCYKNADICCASCEPYHDPSSTDCAYGDKEKFCATLDYPFGCGLNADACCASCRPYYNASRVGCEYGDKNRDCGNLNYPYTCYSNGDLCCETCAQYYNASRPGCEYGDKTPSCAGLSYPETCYSNGDACCGSCFQYYDSQRVGCEYGDKNPQCKDVVASDRSRCSSLGDTCCLSCASAATDLVG